MALRTTRQCVEVLLSTALVSQQYDVGATSALALSEAAGVSGSLDRSACSAIVLTDGAAAARVQVLAAASALALSDEAARVEFVTIGGDATSAISLTVAAACVVVRAIAAESPLALTAEAARIEFLTTEVDADSAISLDVAASAVVARAVTAWSVLALMQQAPVGRPWYVAAESAVQTLTQEYDPEADAIVTRIDGLEDSAAVARPLSAALSQAIPLRQSASVVRIRADAIDLSAESTLELLGEIRANQMGEGHDWLIVSQSATVDKCRPAKSVLSLTGTAVVSLSVPRGALSALTLTQAAAYSIVSRGVLQQYRPFVGQGASGSPTPPPVTIAPPEHVALPLRLFYPATGTVTDSVVLRAPNLGNKDRLSFNRILRETRGGTLIVFTDAIWPKIQTLVLTFSGLRSVQARLLLAFLETHLGEEIGLLDWEGRAWKGIVSAPTEPVVQDGKDSFSASLEFEGELVPV
jgi:hypothetical protein